MWGQDSYPAAGHAQEISEPSKASPAESLLQFPEGTQKRWQLRA